MADYRALLHTVALAAKNADISLSVFQAMDFTDALIARGVDFGGGTDLTPTGMDQWGKPTYRHDDLVRFARYHEGVRKVLDNKIQAIKALRQATDCGLKAAKDAIEAL